MTTIQSLPLEIVVEVLKYSQNGTELCNTILSGRVFYLAYKESIMAIKRDVWRNDFNGNRIYCQFLTHGSNMFLNPPRKKIQLRDLVDFVQDYIRWAHPSSKISPEDINIPDVSECEMEETHKWVMKWTDAFCEHRLAIHPITEDFVEEPQRPTYSELARISRLWYQIWIYLLLFDLNRVDDESDDPENYQNCHNFWADILRILEQSFTFTEIVIAYDSLMFFIIKTAFSATTHIKRDAAYQNLCRQLRDENHETACLLDDHDEGTIWALASRLGPEWLWKFLSDIPFETQLNIALFFPPTSELSELRDNFRYPNVDDSPKMRKYCPVLRICKGPKIIKVREHWWWWWSDDLDTHTDVHKRVLMWDDWRLKEWGYEFPTLDPPLFFPGEDTSEYERSHPNLKIHFLIEHTREPHWRNTVFPDMNEDKDENHR